MVGRSRPFPKVAGRTSRSDWPTSSRTSSYSSSSSNSGSSSPTQLREAGWTTASQIPGQSKASGRSPLRRRACSHFPGQMPHGNTVRRPWSTQPTRRRGKALQWLQTESTVIVVAASPAPLCGQLLAQSARVAAEPCTKARASGHARGARRDSAPNAGGSARLQQPELASKRNGRVATPAGGRCREQK